MTSPTGLPIAVNLLAVSTNGPRGSLALLSDGRVFEIEWEKKAMQAELATLKLEELLKQANLKLKDLTHLAVNIGPGSFTGIRVGVNLARTLAYSLDLRLAPLTALALIARRELKTGERGLIAVKAIQKFYYAAVYERLDHDLTILVAPASATRDELDSLAQKHSAKVVIEGEQKFETSTMARELIAWLTEWASESQYFLWSEVNPLYIRGSEAEEKLRTGILKPLP